MRLSRAKIIAALAIASAVLAICIGALHTRPVREYVLEQARELVESEWGVAVQAEDFRYNLFSGRASLESLQARAVDATDPLLATGRITIDLGVLDLLRGVVRIESARIDAPRLSLMADSAGRLNLPQTTASEDDVPATAALPILISSLELADGAFSFTDASQGLTVELPRWSLVVTGDGFGADHRVKFQSSGAGQVSLDGREMPITEFSAAALVQPNAVSAESLNLRTSTFSLNADGELNNFEDPTFTANVDVAADAETTAEFLELGESVSGQLQIQAELSGTGNEIEIASTIQSSDLSYRQIRNASIQVDSLWSTAGQTLLVRSFELNSTAGRARIEGRIATGGTAESQVAVRLDGVSLRALSRQFDLPVNVASNASGAADLRWPGIDIAETTGTARVRLSESVPSPAASLVPVGGSLTVRSEGNRIRIDAPEMRILGAQFHGRFTIVNRNSIEGELSGQVPKLNTTLAGVSAVLDGDSSPYSGDLDGVVELSAAIGGTIAHPTARSNIFARDLRFGEIRGAELSIRSEYQQDQLLLPEAALRWQDQTVAMEGAIGLAGPSPALDLRMRAEQVSIGDVLAGLGKGIPVSGQANLSAIASGTTDEPQVSAELNASGLAAYGESLGELTATANWAGQRLEIEKLRLDKPAPSGETGYLEASGSFETGSRQYTLTARGERITLAGLTLPDGPTVRGQFDLAVSGNGSVEEPSLEADLAASELSVDERHFGALRASVAVQEQTASFDAAAEKFNLSAKGAMGISAPHQTELELLAENTDLGQLELILQDGKPVSGSISARVNASGPLDDWENGTLRAEITQLSAALGKHEFRNQGDVHVSYERRAFRAGPAEVWLGDSRISIEGALPLDQTAAPGEIRVSGDLNLDQLASLVPAEEPIAAQGRLALNAALSGSVERLTPVFDASVTRAALYLPALRSPLTEINAKLGLRGGSLALEDLQAEWAGAALSASGQLPVGSLVPEALPLEIPRESAPATLALNLEGFVIDSLPDLPRDLGGLVSLHIDAEAPRFEPEAVRAKLRFDQMQFHYKTFELKQESPATIALEQGRGRIENFSLKGPDTAVQAEGGINLTSERALDLRLKADTDAGILALASDTVSAQGPIRLNLAVTGTAESPDISGALEIDRGQFGMTDPRLELANVDARINLKPDQISIEKFSGTLNGGRFEASGGAKLQAARIEAVNLDVAADDVFLDIPEGLRTVSDAKLTIRPRDDAIVIGGQVRINEGSYTESVDFDQLLFDYLRTSGQTAFETDPDPLLSRVRYAVDVETVEPLILDNNLGELAADVDLRLAGTYYRPGLTGRVQLREGGTLYLSENRYFIDRGVVDFFNEARIEPSLDITARTQVRRKYDIELRMTGGGSEPVATSLTSPSHPELPEPDLISLLLTGRMREELRGEEINVAAEQSLSYLSGRIGSRISRGAESTLGLSEVRIEPNLIAAESDPGARLTVAQNLTDQLQLIYSMDLADSSNQIWIAQYDVTKRLMTQAIKQDDNSYRFDLRHDLQFGGAPGASGQPDARPKPPIGEVRFQGDSEIAGQDFQKIMGIKAGKPFDFFAVRRGADRLEKRLAEQGYLEARVQVERQSRGEMVDLSIRVEAGPRVEFVYEDGAIPEGTRRQVRERWREGIFDAQRAADSARAIRAYLVGEGYHQPEIRHAIAERAAGIKQVTFEIERGGRSGRLELVFEGAVGIEASELEEQIKTSDLEKAVLTEPNRVTEFLTKYYQSNGYLDASVEPPEYRFDESTRSGQAVISIQEGPLYRVGEVEFQGNRAVEDSDLRIAAGISDQQPYHPDLLQEALVHIEERYWRDGYNDVEVGFRVAKNSRQGQVAIRVEIEENQKGIVRRVEVAGNDDTSENLVRGQLAMEPGDTYSFEKISEARRKLYKTGAYSLVDIESDPMDPGQSGPGEKPLNLRVSVRELRPFQVRYGGFFDTERGPGAIVDFTTRNILGSARVLGLRTRYDSEVREARTYLSQPLLRRFPIESTATTFLRREIEAGFITDRTGISFNQETRWKDSFVLNYGYRFERTHTFEQEPDPFVPFDVRLNIAPLTATFSRETRDDILDAARGSFWSNAVEYAPSSLGSDLRFVKYYGQFFKYIPLGEPRPMPFQERLLRPRFSYATGVRVGLARGLGGQVLIPSERFFAGGGTTIRGFAEDTAGPVDFEGAPAGGDAVFVLNNEVRFPMVGFFDGVAFVDIGNVYRTVSDFDPFNVRKSAGFGLRVRTPYFLLRADYGFKLDRKDGESAGAFFFSIGQAF